MFFNRKISALLSLQAAQFAGLVQAVALVKRVRVISTDEEKEAFKCGDSFRLLELYGVKLAEIETFEHIDAEKAKGQFVFKTNRLVVKIEVSLVSEKTILTKRSNDGFQEKTELDQWKPVQGHVWVYTHGHIFPDTSATFIRGPELESGDDLPLQTVCPEI